MCDAIVVRVQDKSNLQEHSRVCLGFFVVVVETNFYPLQKVTYKTLRGLAYLLGEHLQVQYRTNTSVLYRSEGSTLSRTPLGS